MSNSAPQSSESILDGLIGRSITSVNGETSPAPVKSPSKPRVPIRFVAILSALGFIPSEIAYYLDEEVEYVIKLLDLHDTQLLVKAFVDELGKDAMEILFLKEIEKSVRIMTQLRDSEKVPAAVRANMAVKLVEFGRGRAANYVKKERQEVSQEEAQTADADMQGELSALRKERQRYMKMLGETLDGSDN